MIYLDYSANTPVSPRVLQSFTDAAARYVGNPNSNHPAGLAAKAAIDEATARIAAALGVQPDEIIYTSGASESNNTAIRGILHASRHIGRHVLTTPLEHPSVSGCLTAAMERGYEIDMLSVGHDGRIDPEEVRSLLRPDTVLVAMTAVDSELGTVQPVREVARVLRGVAHCCLHVDATQAIGKLPFSFDEVDTVSFAPHKFGGIVGSGVLFKRHGLAVEPLIYGGTSTTLYRSGTPAAALAVSTAEAVCAAIGGMEDNTAIVRGHNARLRDFFARYPKVQLNSPDDAIPHILNLSVEGVRGTSFQQALAAAGICVSVKSACAVEGTPSRAVMAVSRDRKRALSSFRISLSHLTTADELLEFETVFDRLYTEFETHE